MFLGELFIIFCIFICLAYTSTQNTILAIHGLLSAAIGLYLSLIITTAIAKSDIENSIQIFFIFYFTFGVIAIAIKYGLLKLINPKKNIHSHYVQFKSLQIAIKYFIASLLACLIFLINLSFMVKIEPFFIISHSGFATKYIIDRNILNLFKDQHSNNEYKTQQSIDVALMDTAQAFNLNDLQTQILLQAYNTLDNKTKQNLQNAFYINQNYKYFILDILAKYIDKYPLLNPQDTIEISKIDDIRNTILYGPDYIKSNAINNSESTPFENKDKASQNTQNIEQEAIYTNTKNSENKNKQNNQTEENTDLTINNILQTDVTNDNNDDNDDKDEILNIINQNQ